MACKYKINGLELTKDEFLNYVKKQPIEESAKILGILTTPAAPFITDTNKYVQLGLKVALKEAVKQGADKIAWTTGEQQNDRYDLSKSVDEVFYAKKEDGTFSISANKGDNLVFREKNIKPERLEDYIGKELASKIIEDSKTRAQNSYKGNDLKVGGKGMKGFYDNIVPNVAKAVIKELTGKEGVVGDVILPIGGWKNTGGYLVGEANYVGGFGVYDSKGDMVAEFDTRKEADDYIAKKANTTQQSIEITPELKASVEQGTPLFGVAKAESDLKKAWKDIDDKIQKAKDDLNKLFKEGENLGFAFDPKREAERQFNIHKTLVTLAKLYIQKGIQSAQDFANEIGLKLQDVARAWEEASGKKETTKQDLENEPYDIDAIRQGLSQRQAQLQMSQIEADAQTAISMGATDINSFKTAMASNSAFNALPEASKANVYYNAISVYANNQAIQQAQQTPQIINLKDQTWLEKLKTAFQDRLARLKDVQKQMELAGINILDQANAALKYELLIGKAKAKIDDKFQDVVKSRSKKNPALLERLVNDGGDPDELGLYMYALHAPERNAAIAQERQDEFNQAVLDLTNKISTATSQSERTKAQNELNKLVSGQGKVRLLPDAGSGMTNKQAQEIIDAVEQSGKRALYDNYAQQFRNEVINPTLDAQLAYGLITQEQYDAIKSKYQNYVPLQVVEKALQKRQGGSIVGGSIKGKDIFRAKGSDLYKYTERYNPLLSSLFAFNNATIRGEQNTAATAFLELAKTDTNNEIFEIHKPQYTPIVDSNGDVKYLMPTTPQSLKDKSIELKVKGKPVFVEIKDPALRKAMQEQGIHRGFRGLNIINNWLRNTATIMNPEFIFTNFGRDFETALINIQSEVKDLNVKGVTKQIANPKNIIKAGKGIIDDYKNNHSSEWAKAAKEYRDNGGQVSWFQKETLEEYVQDINNEIKKIKKGENIPTKVFNSLGEAMFLAQSTVEQSIRLSTYKALRDAGVSAERAASAAKNITVNFENKGNWSGFIDSLYLFANAGIQGSYRMARAIATSRKAQAAAGVLFVTGILEAYINDIFGGEDDDDEQISDSIKERNFVLVNPNNPKDPYFKFPLAYGANVFKHAGNLVYDIANKRKKPLDASVMLLKAIYNQFSPIQGATITQALSPTFLDPIVQGIENKNFFGSPIKPEQPKYSPPKKESDLYFQSVRPISKNMATWLNNNTGGSAVEAGYIDISPEYIDHYYDAFTGGTGRFFANTGVTIKSVATDEKLSLRNMPFVRSFVGDTNEKRNLEFIYETLNSSSIEELSEEKIKKLEKELDLAVKTGAMEEKQAKKIKNSVKKGQDKIKKYKGVYELEEEKKKETKKGKLEESTIEEATITEATIKEAEIK